MKFLSFYKIVFFSVLLLVFSSSCSKEYDTETFDNRSLISIKLQGTQSQLSKANIEIIDVQLRILEDETNPDAWVSLHTIHTGIHDLTQLTEDQVVTLVDFEEVPVGYIYNIKIVLGHQNSVVKNGVEYHLDMSNCQNTSINVIEKELHANKLYDFLIEFDVDQSIVFSSEGEAHFTPKMNTLLRRFELF